MKLTSRAAAVGVGMLVALSGVTTSTSAADPGAGITPDAVEAIEIVSDSTVLSLDLDTPLPYEEALEVANRLRTPSKEGAPEEQIVLLDTSSGHSQSNAGRASISTAMADDEDIDLDPPITPRPTVQQINCNRSYAFGDSRGQYSLQRACGVQMAPWGYRLSASMQAICVNGTLRESGMSWVKNGRTMPLGAPHSALPCYYQLHGRYNPAKRGDIVDYRDVLNFRHNLGSGGNARLTVFGSFKLLGP